MVISVKPWLELGGSERVSAFFQGGGGGRYSPDPDDLESNGRDEFELKSIGSATAGDSTVGFSLLERDRGTLPAAGEIDSQHDDSDEVELSPAGIVEPANFYHQPIMVEEVLAALNPEEGRLFFDGTLGGGGHSEALLRAGARVIACDQDTAALAFASERLASFGERFKAVHGNFSDMDRILADAGHNAVDGILLDLGVSSRQLDDAERGFSFSRSGPLDMRMDPTAPETAADLVNDADSEELERIIREYGEEPAARRIAGAIVAAREAAPIETTDRLAAIVEAALPRRGKRHPATRTFQGLRIALNAELVRLEEALEKSAGCLNQGGVLAVISFHSLEDRIVKHFLRRHSEKTIDRPEWPAPKPNPDRFFELLSRRPQMPGPDEVEANPRSRSAKLRVGIRI